MGDNIFSIRGLSFSYGKHEILKDLDMDIPSGAVTTLIGANGCGKSTLFGLMTKNLKPASGEIKLAGCRISHMNIKEFAKQVGIVHQWRSWYHMEGHHIGPLALQEIQKKMRRRSTGPWRSPIQINTETSP